MTQRVTATAQESGDIVTDAKGMDNQGPELDRLRAQVRALSDQWAHDWAYNTGVVRTGIDYVTELRATLDGPS